MSAARISVSQNPRAASTVVQRSRGDGVCIQGFPLRDAYPHGTANERVPVLFEIDVATPVDVQRPSVELCIVLDKSSSMAGAKLVASKAAVHNIIDMLSESDVLHLVLYSNVVEIAFTHGTRACAGELHSIVDQITANGTTNISEALESAAKLLTESSLEECGSKRIFLLSDGSANVGVCTYDGLMQIVRNIRDGGMVVSAFGVGNDFDEQVMRGMADNGRGSYFFLRQSVVRETIENSMANLQQVMGTQAEIHIEVVAPCVVRRIHRQLDEGPEVDVGTTVRVGDLRVGGHKQLLVEIGLSVPPDTAIGTEMTLFRYELRFKSTINDVRSVAIPGSVVVRIGDGALEFAQVRVSDAMHQLEAAEKEFARLMENGQTDAALNYQLNIISGLEELESLDTRGYVTAQLRRLRRVVDRVQNQHISSRQARLMIGESLTRSMSGDLDGLASPPGTPNHDFLASPPGTPNLDFLSNDDDDFAIHYDGMRSPYRPNDIRASGTSIAGANSRVSQCAACFNGLLQILRRQRSTQPRTVIPRWDMRSGNEPTLSPAPRLSPRSPLPIRQRLFPESPPLTPPLTPLLTPREPMYSALGGEMRRPTYLLADGFDKSNLPNEFSCPICLEVMVDPVVASDGHTYERSKILEWFHGGSYTSPKTGLPMPDLRVIPNHALRAQIMTKNDELMLQDAQE